MVRSRARGGLAWLTILGLGLAICAPIWHQGHHSVIPATDEVADHTPDIHLCSTGGHAIRQIRCPICLSQRLLTHSDTEATPEFAAPTSGTAPEVARAISITITVSHLAQPRAPPRV